LSERLEISPEIWRVIIEHVDGDLREIVYRTREFIIKNTETGMAIQSVSEWVL